MAFKCSADRNARPRRAVEASIDLLPTLATYSAVSDEGGSVSWPRPTPGDQGPGTRDKQIPSRSPITGRVACVAGRDLSAHARSARGLPAGAGRGQLWKRGQGGHEDFKAGLTSIASAGIGAKE